MRIVTYGLLGLLFTCTVNSCGLMRKGMGREKEEGTPLPSVTRTPPTNSVKPGTNSVQSKMPALKDDNQPTLNFTTTSIDQFKAQQFRYSILLNVDVESLSNGSLYTLIDDWLGTPYRIGGQTKRGVDCSGFVQNLTGAIYGAYMARTAREQLDQCASIRKEELREGDLVFFNTRGGVSHVGVYLHNDKFVHASTSNGVIISDMKEAYWSRRFVAAGRLPNSQ